MAILESVRELASKLGAETNGRDITDQINKINKHLDETALGGRDIADAVRTYSKNASGGGGGGETFEVELEYDTTSPNDFTTNKSYDMVKAAIQANKVIKFIWSIKDQGEVIQSGTTTAVDYNSEADFMAIATSGTDADKTVSFLFQWGNSETYTTVSKGVVSLYDELH